MNSQISTIKDISEFLSSKGIKPSYQRVKILERMYKIKDHPTVNDIYKDLIDEIPSLSKTTVYNTLAIFIENGIAKSFTVEGNEARYDILSSLHGHFFCLKCNKIFDFEINEPQIYENILDGVEILESEISIKGICKTCKK